MARTDVIRDMSAGLVCSTVALSFSVATGVLIYSGPLSGLADRGIAAGLVTSAVVSIVAALFGQVPTTIAVANSTTAAPLAALVAGLAPAVAGLPPAAAAASALFVIAVTTLATGLAQLGLGFARAGRIVRTIPFPVVAGFLGTSGWLLATGALRLALGRPVTLLTLPQTLAEAPALAAATLGLAAVIFVATGRWRSPFVVPLSLIVPTLLFHAAAPGILAPWLGADLLGLPPSAMLLAPVAPGGLLPAGLLPPLLSEGLGAADPRVLLGALGTMGAYVVLIVVQTLISAASFEPLSETDIDADRDLRVHGLANLASALLGGYVGSATLGLTAGGMAAGGRGRLMGLTCGAVALLALVFASPALALIPRFVLGALLLQVAARILLTWCWQRVKALPAGERLLVLGIVLVAALFGVLPSVLCGLIGGCVVFALEASRVDVIAARQGLDERPSPLLRPYAETAVLAAHGPSVRILSLRGSMFFGTAFRLRDAVAELTGLGTVTAVIFDLGGVTSLDSSAEGVLKRLQSRLSAAGIACTFAGARPRLARRLAGAGLALAPDLDRALEAAETAILARHAAEAATGDSMPDWLGRILGTEADAAALLALLRPADYAPEAYLCRQGEATDVLLFIESGRVSVNVGPPSGERCVRLFGPHTIAGETGFLLGLPRTASLRAEAPTRVWSLDRRDFERIEATQPGLVIALLRHIVRLQTERLGFATRLAASVGG